jgi:hypothetical protein
MLSVTVNPAGVLVQVEVLLQGMYNIGTNSMSTALYDDGLLPNNQPYNAQPWAYTGTENRATNGSLPSNLVDWVLVEMRDANDPTLLIEQKAALLLSDGTVVDANGGVNGVYFNNLNEGSFYYPVVRHRNHLDVLASASASVSGQSLTFNFTTSPTQAFGINQQASVGSRAALFQGDMNANGVISVADFNLYTQQAATLNAYTSTDVNFDGAVTVSDFNGYLPNTSLIGVSAIRY